MISLEDQPTKLLQECKSGWPHTDPNQIIIVEILGVKVIVLGETCQYCLKIWADKKSQICPGCKKPFLPRDKVAKFDEKYFHLDCSREENFVGFWSEDGTVQFNIQTIPDFKVIIKD